jgi:hypothetical protein
MKFAYNSDWLRNLHLVKEAKQWMVSGLITKEQHDKITEQHPSPFYHPNFIIRILLMLATFIVLGAITGLLILTVMSADEAGLAILSILYGLISLTVLDRVFIASKNHYKSGITEAILYHAILFIMLGCIDFFEDSPAPYAVVLGVVFAFTAYRYLDLISTAGALGAFAWLVFYLLYQAGGAIQQVIPIVFIVLFTPLFFVFRKLRRTPAAEPWEACLIVSESICLLFMYAAGNYLVVRELSIELMDLELQPGQDIPLAFVFYALTVIIPMLFLFFGIRNKDLVLIRVSLIVLAFSVFTFKYYFSLGHHEITLTVGGIIMLLLAVSLLRWLKIPKHGYTRENILNEKWANSNAQAFIVSQTLGVTSKPEHQPDWGGGESGGGGAASKF